MTDRSKGWHQEGAKGPNHPFVFHDPLLIPRFPNEDCAPQNLLHTSCLNPPKSSSKAPPFSTSSLSLVAPNALQLLDSNPWSHSSNPTPCCHLSCPNPGTPSLAFSAPPHLLSPTPAVENNFSVKANPTLAHIPLLLILWSYSVTSPALFVRHLCFIEVCAAHRPLVLTSHPSRSRWLVSSTHAVRNLTAFPILTLFFASWCVHSPTPHEAQGIQHIAVQVMSLVCLSWFPLSFSFNFLTSLEEVQNDALFQSRSAKSASPRYHVECLVPTHLARLWRALPHSTNAFSFSRATSNKLADATTTESLPPQRPWRHCRAEHVKCPKLSPDRAFHAPLPCMCHMFSRKQL